MRHTVTILFTILFLLAGGAWSQARGPRLETWLMREGTTIFATFQSHNSKVHAFANGAIVSYLAKRGRDEVNEYVVAYVDYNTRREIVLLKGEATTNAPCVARKGKRQFGVFINDYKPRRVIFKLLSIDPSGAGGEVIASVDIAATAGYIGKYACAHDEAHFQFIGNDGVLVTIDDDGNVQRRTKVFKRSDGKGLSLQYPHLLYDAGRLHLAFTTSQTLSKSTRRFLYWSILYVESSDGGQQWTSRLRTPQPLPISIDNADVRITDANDGTRNRWLINLTSAGRHILAQYAEGSGNPEELKAANRPVIKILPPDRASTDATLPAEFRGQRQSGIFIHDNDHPERVYFLTFQGAAMVVLRSNDQGLSWRLWYKSEGSFACPYAVDGARQITQARIIVGFFTERGAGCRVGDTFANDAVIVAFRLSIGE